MFKSSVFAVFLKHLVHMNMMKGLRYMLVQWLLPNLMAFVLHCAWKQYDYFVEANFRALPSFHTCHMFMHIWTLIGLTVWWKPFTVWNVSLGHDIPSPLSLALSTLQSNKFSFRLDVPSLIWWNCTVQHWQAAHPRPQFRLPPTLQPQALYHTWVIPFLFLQ